MEFMVDTGADTTVLSRSDASVSRSRFRRSRRPVRRWRNRRHDENVLGSCRGLSTNDPSFSPIGIPEKIADDGSYEEMPSLLGRDIINQSVMVYDFPRGKLEFVFPLPTSSEHIT